MKKVMFEIVKKHSDIPTKFKLGTKLFYSKIDSSYNIEQELTDIGMQIAFDWYEKEFVPYYANIKDRSIENLLSIIDQKIHIS